MTIASPPDLLTTEQLLALPDDGKDRWLIRGELRENDMTRRNRGHSRIEAIFTGELLIWLKTQPLPRGEVLCGEAGVRLRRNPDTTVGIDVAYISPETSQANPRDEGWVEGAPILAIEILSPSDRVEEIDEKIENYLENGVKLVWIVNPKFQTITVYRHDAKPVLFNITHVLEGDPYLPGFRIAVSEIFAR